MMYICTFLVRGDHTKPEHCTRRIRWYDVNSNGTECIWWMVSFDYSRLVIAYGNCTVLKKTCGVFYRAAIESRGGFK